VKTGSVLLTGVSSFTGFWFAHKLYEEGFKVVCPLPRKKNDYNDLKLQRLELLNRHVNLIYECPYGSAKFLNLCEDHYDVLCLHGAYVLDYSSDRFPLTHALSENLKSSEKVLENLFSKGCRRVIWTSSVFEDAVNLNDTQSSKPGWYRYALSKYLSYSAMSELCRGYGFEFSRLVITNPFGPLEDKKLSYHLFNSFLNKEKEFTIKTPHYVRDMIHVQNLAEIYSKIIISKECIPEIRPCEYSGSMISFAKLYQEEVSKRLAINLTINYQNMEFDEPYSLTNDQHVTTILNEKNSEQYWDELCDYYINK
tara:strand:- start:203 stop:1132 length:930 start_codon:yes stop_codon:yes gene_type:complete